MHGHLLTLVLGCCSLVPLRCTTISQDGSTRRRQVLQADYLGTARTESSTFEPTSADFYRKKNKNVTDAFRVNGTYFAQLNKDAVPTIKKTVNGSFALLPINESSSAASESSFPDGYGYGEVLGLSWLFYEAQRSGKLPPTNRIAWRGDSALGDKAQDGSDITGGWYDAGDHLKLHFPLAWSAGVLAWGFIEFQEGYAQAAQTPYALDNLRWIGNYLIKCHYKDVSFVAQVGDVGADHSVWGRAEDMTMPRPSFDVDQNNPGSDLLGQAAGALAAIAIVFEKTDPAYAALCEAHARDLYAIGTTFLGKYSDSVKQAYVYPSSNFMDDLTWGAAWLFRKTGEQQFLQDATRWWQQNKVQEQGGGYLVYNWDSAIWGADTLLAALTGNTNPTYGAEVQRFLDSWIQGKDGISYTPAGLAYASPWGSLRQCSNAALIAMVYSKLIKTVDPVSSRKYSCWARSQIRYMLGDSGRSYVVGYGTNPPSHVHHRGASCPPETAGVGSNQPTCGQDQFSASGPNPNTLFGALAGGPGQDDSYKDDRSDFQKNEVAVDYNAGFTGVLAALTADTDTYAACLSRGDVVHPITRASNNS